jgi:hypothetical protein
VLAHDAKKLTAVLDRAKAAAQAKMLECLEEARQTIQRTSPRDFTIEDAFRSTESASKALAADIASAHKTAVQDWRDLVSASPADAGVQDIVPIWDWTPIQFAMFRDDVECFGVLMHARAQWYRTDALACVAQGCSTILEAILDDDTAFERSQHFGEYFHEFVQSAARSPTVRCLQILHERGLISRARQRSSVLPTGWVIAMQPHLLHNLEFFVQHGYVPLGDTYTMHTHLKRSMRQTRPSVEEGIVRLIDAGASFNAEVVTEACRHGRHRALKAMLRRNPTVWQSKHRSHLFQDNLQTCLGQALLQGSRACLELLWRHGCTIESSADATGLHPFVELMKWSNPKPKMQFAIQWVLDRMGCGQVARRMVQNTIARQMAPDPTRVWGNLSEGVLAQLRTHHAWQRRTPLLLLRELCNADRSNHALWAKQEHCRRGFTRICFVSSTHARSALAQEDN